MHLVHGKTKISIIFNLQLVQRNITNAVYIYAATAAIAKVAIIIFDTCYTLHYLLYHINRI